MQKERIAVIGIGCRFPGNVNNTESLWKLLSEGREAVTEVPSDRFNIRRYYDKEPGLPGKSMARRGGFINNIDQFDPQFFGISPREAPYVDPQHRLVLETSWEAIEDAGMVLDFEQGTDMGVFVGISHNDYQGIQSGALDHFGISAHSATGSAHSIAANRISYCLNLRGPSVAMDTACSSALTAVHTACEFIRAGRGDVALAGGVTVMITPGGFIGFSQAAMLSPEGRCAAFDASASGFVRGEGASMVLLKRLSKAIEDNDPIKAVIIGTAINQDGHTNGISLPSPEAQARLVRDACADAGIVPEEIGFVEAHGTGTAAGDPIEAHALAEALCVNRSSDSPLPIGSVKTNLGHLETAAGMAGLLKAILILQHRKIPPSLHFQIPSPHINFEKLKLRVPTELEPFPEVGGDRMVGINSFGFGGSNAHVILAEAPHLQADHRESPTLRPWPLVLSARSEGALRGAAAKLGKWLKQHTINNGSSPTLPDLTYTLGARRNHHPHRLTLAAETLTEVGHELEEFAAGIDTAKIRVSYSPRPEREPRVAFVMSGQGGQWWGMGRELMKHESVFRKTMKRCDAALQPWAGFSLLEELSRDEAASRVHRTAVGQPAIFAIQVALAELWASWGVRPSAIIGHSVGELAAACIAGILSIEEGARVVALRARLMHDCARGEGRMLAVGMSEEEARAFIAHHDRTVTISAYNGPRSVTLSGPRRSIEIMAAELDGNDVFARIIPVDHPFHHAMMQPAADALRDALRDLCPGIEHIPFFSTVTGHRQAGLECDAAYWARGILQAVRFSPAVDSMATFGVDVWLELSAHPALSRSINECLIARNQRSAIISSVRREREYESLIEAALDLHRACVTVDFAAMTPSRRFLPLPAYAWERSRWWNETREWHDGRLSSGGRGFLETRLPRAMPTWITRFDRRHAAFLKDHKVENRVIFPAAGFVEMALEAGQQLFEGRPFAVEDLEIRKPLILPEQISSVQLEFSYSPNDRTFAIQSRSDRSSTWSLHVVGTLRSERTDSLFANSTWQAVSGAASLDVAEFYQHLNDLGLCYGEAFRPIRQLSAENGRSDGRVVLSDAIAERANDYAVHPVLFDGALQIFSAGAATVEDRRSRMKLPVLFERILFLGPPGASTLVSAKIRDFNDDFLEGDIAIYDDSGRPSLRVHGFRAIAISGASRNSAPEGVTYHIAWERSQRECGQTEFAPIPLTEMRTAAEFAMDKVLQMRGREEIQKALFACDDLAASQIANGLQKMGISEVATFSAESLRVTTPMMRIFDRLTTVLSRRDLLKIDGDRQWIPTRTFFEAAHGADRFLRDFIENHPGYLPEALLCAENAKALGQILRSEKDAVQVLFAGIGADLLDHFYGDGLFTRHWLSAIAAAVAEVAKRLPEGRGLRILEVGAGTGGLAAQVLSRLERGVHLYTFTDVSAAFFSSTGQKLAAFPEVEFKVFDLEKSAMAQGFDAEKFDLIIGTNVLHAVRDVRFAVRNLRELLVPGGSLLFMDTATPQLWTESVFGLTSGWWRFTDFDLRRDQPLLERAQWEAVLKECGFVEATSVPGLIGPTGGEGQILLMARKDGVQMPGKKPANSRLPAEKSWLIFSDGSDLANGLIRKLRATGARCRVARKGDAYVSRGDEDFLLRPDVLEDWQELVRDWAITPPERVVYLWTLEADMNCGRDLADVNALLYFSQAVNSCLGSAKIRFDLVTRGCQPVGTNSGAAAVAQAPTIGLIRVIQNEYANLSCRGIDLDPIIRDTDLPNLWTELLRNETEREVAFRGEGRYVRRLERGCPAKIVSLDPKVPLRLEIRDRGNLDSLRFVPFVPKACAPGEVIIDVKASGMNFRDVLKAIGMYPGEAPDARFFGDEAAGIVAKVGEGVTHVAPGDRVFGLAISGIANRTLARWGDVYRIPDGLSYEEAATVPVVFLTAWHALTNVARMKKGEHVLVHAGAGGVGMAAIQIALHLGAEVVASAGNPSKRALLETMGVKHVVDSRRGDFVEGVMEFTDGRGVDVVLNALAAEAIPMGLSCLAEFGRFIEIGKRDIYQNSRIPLRPLRRNASFHVVAMDSVFNGDEKLTHEMLGQITRLLEEGALKPLPFRAIPATRVDSAFRLIAGGKHIGKVVIAFAEPFLPDRGEPLVPPFSIRSDGTYLITGAFGGYGQILARWLVRCGARHLVLSSRSGASTPEAAALLEELRLQDVDVHVVKADVGTLDDVATLFDIIRKSSRPLLGVFHLAMVIDDAPLARLTPERMWSVFSPKAHGAWLLHQATRNLPLDCFVMFSSVSSIFGNPAQGNYSAANAFLDSLAHHRRALGLPALTVNWGVLGGHGYVARNERVAEFLARQGTSAIGALEATALLDSFLQSGKDQVVALRVDWAKWKQFFRGMQENPFLERIFSTIEEEESGRGRSDWRKRIETAAPAEREAAICEAVREVVGSVLRVKPDSLRNDQPLTDLGLDSLMGVEIETSLELAVGVALPPTSLMRARTIGQIGSLIADHLGSERSATVITPTEIPVSATDDAGNEVDLEALSEEDIDLLLATEDSGDKTKDIKEVSHERIPRT